MENLGKGVLGGQESFKAVEGSLVWVRLCKATTSFISLSQSFFYPRGTLKIVFRSQGTPCQIVQRFSYNGGHKAILKDHLCRATSVGPRIMPATLDSVSIGHSSRDQ